MALTLVAPLVTAQGEGTFAPPHSDSGVDTDLDTFFDFLRIDVEVDVTTPGDFIVDVTLTDETNTSLITGAAGFVSLDGPSTVSVDLPGSEIRESGFDGPYTANLLLFDDAFNLDDADTHMTFAYLHTDFEQIEQVPATFEPPHSDEGINTDENPLFDLLVVNARVNLSEAGMYIVTGDLINTSLVTIDSTSTIATLSPGIQTVTLDFAGWRIRESGSDGQYVVALALFDASFQLLAEGTHTTSAYEANEFELRPAALDAPHEDRGLDSDGDGLFNAIVVEVSVLVEEAGDYAVSAGLYDDSLNFLGPAYAAGRFGIGPQVVRLEFSTLPMVALGTEGPYTVGLLLYGAEADPLDTGSHTTGPYGLSQFDPLPAQFGPPHSDRGIDRDSDGEYNVLEVNVTIDVTDSGIFIVTANLFNSAGTAFIAEDSWFGPLSAGTHSVPLYFPGVTIRSSGFDGPYFVNLTLLPVGESLFFPIDGGGHSTPAYSATAFESSTPADLTGTIRDAAAATGIPSAFVTAYNYLDSFSESVMANSMGNYSLELYAGDWVVTYDDAFLGLAYQSDLVRISLAGPTVQDVDLAVTEAIVNSAELSFTTWDAADVKVRSVSHMDTPTFRVTFDWFLGNQDEFLDQAEFESFIEAVPSLIELPSDSAGMFLVDGTHFDLVPGSASFSLVNISGGIDSVVPPEIELVGSYISNTPIPSGAAHTLDLLVAYDAAFVMNDYTIRFSSPDVLLGFSASPSISVTGIGTDTAIVDPGSDPDPLDLMTAEWMSLEAGVDTTGPTMTAPTEAPDPVELGAVLAITTQVSDLSGVASVKVEIRDPTGALEGNFTMSNPTGTTYRHQFTPDATGEFTYKITATDRSGNHAVVSGTFLVRDTTLPVASAGSDRTVAEGTSVTFDGSGSSDRGGIATYSWTLNEGGAVTLTGSNPTYRFDNPGTFTITLTVTDASGNVDTDTVVITVTATTGTIQGTATGPSGQTISGATVRLLSGTTEIASTTTDANGRFTFAEVAPGTYTVRIEAAGFDTKATSATVTAGDVEPVSIELTALQTVGFLGLALEIWGGLIIAVAAILAVTLLLLRRRPKRPA